MPRVAATLKKEGAERPAGHRARAAVCVPVRPRARRSAAAAYCPLPPRSCRVRVPIANAEHDPGAELRHAIRREPCPSQLDATEGDDDRADAGRGRGKRDGGRLRLASLSPRPAPRQGPRAIPTAQSRCMSTKGGEHGADDAGGPRALRRWSDRDGLLRGDHRAAPPSARRRRPPTRAGFPRSRPPRGSRRGPPRATRGGVTRRR